MTAEVMGGADPVVGQPLSTRAVTTHAAGRPSVVLDAPATAGTRPIARSVRVRRGAGPQLGMPDVIAATPLRTAGRAVTLSPAAASGAVGETQRWSITGPPDGARMWAHVRHGGQTIARVALGVAGDPCGRLDFALRVLPAGHERAGTWDLWLTARRTFRIPRTGVYVHRRIIVAANGSAARASFEPLRVSLVPTTPASAPRSRTRSPRTRRGSGVISLGFVRAGDAPVDFFERVDDRLLALGTANAAAGAAPGAPGVQAVRLDRVFTADGYSDTIRYRGRRVRVRVREIDGVHLNVAGTTIAAAIVARLVRRSR